MKIIKSIALVFAFTAIINSCSPADESMATPKGVGFTVFNMFKNTESGGKKAYLKYFISVTEIDELARYGEVVTEEKARREMAITPVDDWNIQVIESYDTIKKLSDSVGINWKNIEFSKFEPEEKVKDGMRSIHGDMYFTHEGKKFEMIIDAVWNGEEYRLVSLVGPLED